MTKQEAINKIKQKFCKHDFQWYAEDSRGFCRINGRMLYLVCTKCGKVNGSVLQEYEGMGFK